MFKDFMKGWYDGVIEGAAWGLIFTLFAYLITKAILFFSGTEYKATE